MPSCRRLRLYIIVKIINQMAVAAQQVLHTRATTTFVSFSWHEGICKILFRHRLHLEISVMRSCCMCTTRLPRCELTSVAIINYLLSVSKRSRTEKIQSPEHIYAPYFQGPNYTVKNIPCTRELSRHSHD